MKSSITGLRHLDRQARVAERKEKSATVWTPKKKELQMVMCRFWCIADLVQ